MAESEVTPMAVALLYQFREVLGEERRTRQKSAKLNNKPERSTSLSTFTWRFPQVPPTPYTLHVTSHTSHYDTHTHACHATSRHARHLTLHPPHTSRHITSRTPSTHVTSASHMTSYQSRRVMSRTSRHTRHPTSPLQLPPTYFTPVLQLASVYLG